MSNTPRIYVADLAAYNEGKLIGSWLDLTDYSSGDDVMDAIKELLEEWSEEQGVNREEYAIDDTENIPEGLLDRYSGLEEFDNLMKGIELADDNDIPLEVIVEYMNYVGINSLSDIRDLPFNGRFDSEKDFAYDLVEQGVISDLSPYLEMTTTDMRITAGEEADNYVDNMTDRELVDAWDSDIYDEIEKFKDNQEKIDELNDEIDELNDEIDELESETDEETTEGDIEEQLEKIKNLKSDVANLESEVDDLRDELSGIRYTNLDDAIDDAREGLREQKYDEIYEELERDAVGYFVENFGYSESELADNSAFSVDYDKLAEELEQDYHYIRHNGDIYVFSAYKGGGKIFDLGGGTSGEKKPTSSMLERRIKGKLSKSFELPLEMAIYVPSTDKANVIIPKTEFRKRIEEVEAYLSDLFGGNSSTSVDGGYMSTDKGLIKEDVARVSTFGQNDGFEGKFNTLVDKIIFWCGKWGQESMGFEFEGDMFYISADAKFEDGGSVDIRLMDTVGRVDTQGFADISQYGKGGIITKKDREKLVNELIKNRENELSIMRLPINIIKNSLGNPQISVGVKPYQSWDTKKEMTFVIVYGRYLSLEMLVYDSYKKDNSFIEVVGKENAIDVLNDILDDIEKSINKKSMKKGGGVGEFDDIMKENVITEKQINLIKRRLNANPKDASVEKIVNYIWDEKPTLTSDQNKKGLEYLMNLWKSPSGKERVNNPFGYREQDALENFASMQLSGFHDISRYGQKPFFVPLYIVNGKGDSSFEYYIDSSGVNIVGERGMQVSGEIDGDKLYQYGITYELVTPESAEMGDFEETGWEVERENSPLEEILRDAYFNYGIYEPTDSFHTSWSSTSPDNNRDYFEKGHERYYTLFINNIDGSEISDEERAFITEKLKSGRKMNWDSDDKEWWMDGGMMANGGTLIEGKTLGNRIKSNLKSGSSVVIDGTKYTCLGKGKWKSSSGENLNWVEVAAKASAKGSEKIMFNKKMADGGVMAGGGMIDAYTNNIYKNQSEYDAESGLYSFARENGYGSSAVDKAIQVYKYDTEENAWGEKIYTKSAIRNMLNMISDIQFSDGGMMANGGETEKDIFRYRNKLVSMNVGKDLPALDFAIKVIDMLIDGELSFPKEMADGGMMAKGGRIQNQYEDRTPQNVWDYGWSKDQKTHFLSDHSKKIERALGRSVEYYYRDYKFNDLMPQLQKVIADHVNDGQYADGGVMAKGGGTEKKWVVEFMEDNGQGYKTIRVKAKTKSEAIDKGFRELSEMGENSDDYSVEYAHTSKYSDGGVMARGGGTTFKKKSDAIAKRLVGTKVPKRLQGDYGKTYDKDEAKEAGNRIVGSMIKKYEN